MLYHYFCYPDHDLHPLFFPSLPFYPSANSHLMTPNTSRATTPVGDREAFDPSCPSVSPGDSVLLPIGKVPGYLDTALKALTLHTEARTSFITYAFSFPTFLSLKSHRDAFSFCSIVSHVQNSVLGPGFVGYWLPDLLKHEYVALRFLTQASYEQAAKMLRLTCARHRHSRFHALPRRRPGRLGFLVTGCRTCDCGGRCDVLGECRWDRLGACVRSPFVPGFGMGRYGGQAMCFFLICLRLSAMRGLYRVLR